MNSYLYDDDVEITPQELETHFPAWYREIFS
jgi:hypothetical protein